MPEISRFFGIVIRMFVEPSGPHHRPHFHAYYQSEVGIVAFDLVELIGGALPLPQRRLVLAWAEIHRSELLEDWERLRGGRLPFRIAPLR
jgi:hypothetical protein